MAEHTQEAASRRRPSAAIGGAFRGFNSSRVGVKSWGVRPGDLDAIRVLLNGSPRVQRLTAAMRPSSGRPGEVPPAPRSTAKPGFPIIQGKFILPEEQKQAQLELQATYPDLVIWGDKAANDSADSFWETHMRGQGLEPFLRNLLRSSPAAADTPVRITLHYELNELRVQLEVRKPGVTPQQAIRADTKLLTVNYAYTAHDNGPLSVKLESIVATQAPTGTAKRFLGQGLLEQFEHVGVGKISLKASGVGGGRDGVFVWARYGFVPVESDWEIMRARGLERIAAHQQEPWYAEAKEAVSSRNPRAIRHLVVLSWRHKGEMVKFLNEMLDASGEGWHGQLDLGNEQDRAWIGSYIAKGSEDAAIFAKLLGNLV